MGNNRIDDSILATVIYGRIEPKIYAFETAAIPNYLKVGDTFRTVQERLNEWRNAGFKDLRKVGDWSAEIKGKDIYFRDYAVHEYLEPQHKRLTKDVFPGRPYSQEFFKNASKKDVEDAIRDIVTSYGQTGTNYTYYGIKERTAIESVYPRDPFDWEPRNPLQTDAISKFEVALENDRANLLMYAVMRFGKSFTSLCCAKAIKAKFVLVVSGKADVADEWKENVQRPGQFENFVFFNSRSLKKNDKLLSDAKKDINKCIVLFLTLQDLSKEKERFKELFESQIDLMIIDETHFGARAETLGKVIADAHYQKDSHLEEIEKSDGIKNESLSSLQRDKAEKELEKATKGLNVKVKLHLSGTPYRILMGSEFEKDDIISFCQYSDIISEKERWYKENIADGRQEETGKEEWENPYYGFPQMVRFAFSLNRSAMNKIKELKEKGYSYHLSALFAPRSVEKDDKREYRKFVYESEVLDFLQAIDGYKSDNNILSFLDNQRIKDGKLCRHIVMVLPYCASCDAMEALIAEKKSEFSNLSEYEIINISGIDSKYNKISEVKSKIKSCESKNIKTITLTVNRMLTGCTVPEWDTMIFLKDTASPQDYDQAIFRLQSQYVVEYEGTKIVDGKEIKLSMKKDMKPQTLLVDFDPQRMYYLQETKSRVYNINTKDGGNEESEQRIKRDLEVSPIIHISENKLVEVTPTDVLKAVSEYSVNRGITEAAKDIIVDTNLINIDSIKRIIDKEFEITSGKGLTDQTYKEETDLDDDDIKTNGDAVNTDKTDSKDPTGSEKGTTEKETACRIFINKCRSYYRRILFYAFLCKSEEEIKSLNDVLESVSTPENERIFRNLGMNKGFIKLMKKNMSGSALRSLDDKIFDLYRLSHEYDKENNDPIQRATTAINRFGKISDSEVVTPQHIAKEMVDQIPEKDFKKVFEGDDKILDIASKMGEFATAVYRRAVSLNISIDNIRNKIYSIPTSPLSYEFTRFVYEKLGLCVDTIACEFSSYDLLKIKKTIQKGKRAGQPTKEIDYGRIKALLTQKKPFKEIKLSDNAAEGEEKVKFNIVVGNPPYQANVSTSKDNDSLGKQLFPAFTEMVYSASSQYCSLITPSRWFTGDAQDKSFLKLRSFLKEKNNIVKMFIYPSTDEVFSGVIIKGGVNHFLVDKKANSVVEFHTIKKGIDSTEKRNLFEEGFDIVFRSSMDSIIIRKVVNNSSETLSSITTGRNAFGIIGKPESLKKQTTAKKSDDDSITVHCKNGEKRYIAKSKVPKGVEIMEHYKVFISKSAGDPDTDTKVIGVPFFGDKDCVCTDTFFPIGCFDTKEEAENLCKYLKTVFVRYLINVLKSSQNVTQIVYRFVPMQDFSNSSDIEWTKSIADIDAQLFKKYNLENEKDYIMSNIKPME